ncbi:HmuY family protein [Pedobacter sp. AW31-3R]|uniref:HmuY family protein n=1 Tax=Pedobacter sp. AW31-3R TaxID=3445781 RepID=UPI003FA0F3E0
MNLKLTTLLCLTAIISFSACKKDDPAVEPEPEITSEKLSDYITKYSNGVIEVNNYPIDMTRSNGRKLDYFSFDDNAFVTTDKAASLDWDIVFTGANSFIYTNDGTADEESAYYGNGSTVRTCGIIKNFDEVNTVVPAELNFTDGFSVAIIPYSLIATPFAELRAYWGETVFTEAGNLSHIKPDPNRCFIIKLHDGRYVKFQYINMYKNPAAENSATSEKGFLSFRYFVAATGSTDVKTK